MSNELYPIEDKIDDDVREVSCADTYVNFSFPLPDPFMRNADGSYVLDDKGNRRFIPL